MELAELIRNVEEVITVKRTNVVYTLRLTEDELHVLTWMIKREYERELFDDEWVRDGVDELMKKILFTTPPTLIGG